MTNTEFWKNLEYGDGKKALSEILGRYPLMTAATTGLDKKPEVHPLEFLLEKDGAFWFAAAKCTRFYAELSLRPDISICICDEEAGVVLRVHGKASFSESTELRDECISRFRHFLLQYRDEPEMIIAFTILGMKADIYSFDNIDPVRSFKIKDSCVVITGPVIKKKTELRDRMSRIIEERREEDSGSLSDSKKKKAKFRDGMIMMLAETAKALWPRMDIRGIEESALFDTYDEREKYVSFAKEFVGDAVFDKPEDFSYWLSPDKLKELSETKMQ